MLKEFASYKMPDKAKKVDLIFDVNYSGDEDVKDCKTIRFKVNDKIGFIDRKHLFEFLWFIGTNEDHRMMVPQKVRKTRYIEKLIGIKANKDIKKGEMINFKVAFDVPLSEEEIISEVKKGQHNKILKPV